MMRIVVVSMLSSSGPTAGKNRDRNSPRVKRTPSLPGTEAKSFHGLLGPLDSSEREWGAGSCSGLQTGPVQAATVFSAIILWTSLTGGTA